MLVLLGYWLYNKATASSKRHCELVETKKMVSAFHVLSRAFFVMT